MKALINTSNVNVIKYHLYLNTIDNTTVIVTDVLSDLFVRTLTNMGYTPKLISSSYVISDLQIKAIEFGIQAQEITNLNSNFNLN